MLECSIAVDVPASSAVWCVGVDHDEAERVCEIRVLGALEVSLGSSRAVMDCHNQSRICFDGGRSIHEHASVGWIRTKVGDLLQRSSSRIGADRCEREDEQVQEGRKRHLLQGGCGVMQSQIFVGCPNPKHLREVQERPSGTVRTGKYPGTNTAKEPQAASWTRSQAHPEQVGVV